jgi:hypothetical protein
MRMAAITVLMAMASAAAAVVAAGVAVAGQFPFCALHTPTTPDTTSNVDAHTADALHLHHPSHPSAALHRCERASGVPPPIRCSPCSLFRFRAIPRVLCVPSFLPCFA